MCECTAERLFENEPMVEIGELAIVVGENVGTTAMTVAVSVKDGETAVAVDADKVAAMFEATGVPGDWNGAVMLHVSAEAVETTNAGNGYSMRFQVMLPDGANQAFLRV